MGTHHNCYGAKSHMLLVREVAMMLVMDRLTDKPDWHVKVFDETIADKWRQEALAWPEEDLWNRISNISASIRERGWGPERPKNILDKDSVDYCILELRQKAEHFKETSIVPTLDATFSIAKSDDLVPGELHSALRDAFTQLKADQASNPDWHPNTNETVQDLVHPSMYPLVYGRSQFLPDEVVGVDDAVDKWAGKGEVIPRRPEWGDELDGSQRWFGGGYSYDRPSIDKSYWSTIYQWLPANVKFTNDGGVKFTSYINNLHPTKYPGIYTTIEKLIATALPLWDQCLSQYQTRGHRVGAGRHSSRMVPVNPDDENEENWDPPNPKAMLAREAAEKRASGGEDEKVKELEATITHYDTMDWREKGEFEERWREIREPAHIDVPEFNAEDVSYKIDPSRTLRNQFRDAGLQIIVKMASIELTPEKPEFAPGGWHVEGQMNEHIVGTALYYLDSENITDTYLEFRTLTSEESQCDVGQDAYHWMESMYGVRLGCGSGSACLQNYGSVMTPQGRLLAFPNVFQHRVSGFKLADPTKPGHRRFIALWLVDPFTRVISTANVPPQQAEWWAERAFGALANKKEGEEPTDLPPELAQLLLEKGVGGTNAQLVEVLKAASGSGKGRLPPELLSMVRKHLDDSWSPMSRQEAEDHRLKLMESRSEFQHEASENWQQVQYSFCEH
ncbi:hypothetical protein VTI74DRAFT_7339 [Chaetomium olivicolor]